MYALLRGDITDNIEFRIIAAMERIATGRGDEGLARTTLNAYERLEVYGEILRERQEKESR